jgi:hypothetical protein
MAIGDWLDQRLLGGGKTAHPFATKNGIAEFLTMLPASQPAMLVDQMCEAMEAAATASGSAGLEPKAYRAALCEIDAGVQTAVAVLGNMLFRDTRGEQISHPSLKALTDYSTRIGARYAAALEAMPRTGATEEDKQSIALMACRGMIAARRRKKLWRVAYRAPEPEQWQAIAALYARAQAFGVARAALEAYSGEGARTSVHAEFVAALMLETAPLGSLTPTQIECLDLLIRHFGAAFVVADRASAEAPFYVDMARLQAPQRWLEGLPARPTLSFLGPGSAYAKLEGLAEEAKIKDQLPDWAAASDCDMDGYCWLIETLREHWSNKPPQRRHKRAAAGSELLLVHGFTQTRRMIAVSEFAQSGKVLPEFSADKVFTQKFFESIRFGSVNPDNTTPGKPLKKELLPPRQILEKMEMAGDRQLMTRSSVVDASESGFGVALPSPPAWAKLGVLVGFRAPDGLDWEAAVIRRLGRAGGQFSLGLERLRGKTSSARAQPATDVQAARDAVMNVQDALDAILVSGENTLLIVPQENVAAEQILALWTQAGRRVLRIRTSLETGRDFRTMAVQYLD